MTTVVAVMDRAGFDANTDVLVFVQPELRRLTWVPRDLWCPGLGDRVNGAYRRGGWRCLQAALAELDLRPDHCLCLSRTASEAVLDRVRVVVPVPARMVFDYPLTPTTPIEHGRKTIVFEPPMEVLSGERVHQWVGARGGSDLHRLRRQIVLVRRLLERRENLATALANPGHYQLSDPLALADLRLVRSDWDMVVLDDVEPVIIDGKDVLVFRSGRRS